LGTCAGTDVDEMIGGKHDGVFMLDDDEGIPLVPEVVQDADKTGDIAGVKADGGFIENEEGAGE
jgi:hypothetical protein